MGDAGSIPGLGRSPGEGNGNPLHPVFWPVKSHRQRNAAGHSPRGRKESDTGVELFRGQLIISFHLKKTNRQQKTIQQKIRIERKELGSSPHDLQLGVQMG